jgi:hypothetical protein
MISINSMQASQPLSYIILNAANDILIKIAGSSDEGFNFD